MAALSEQVSKQKPAPKRSSVPDGECILGNNPETCASAKPYRYQQGCRAVACKAASSNYYKAKRGTLVETPVVVKPAKKVLRRAPK